MSLILNFDDLKKKKKKKIQIFNLNMTINCPIWHLKGRKWKFIYFK